MAINDTHYRHEWKYRISFAEYLVLKQRLRHAMGSDAHADSNGQYQVVSLYFDNSDDRALRQKIDGVARREKFRLRYYNDDTTHILLEKKQKMGGLCLKTSVPISTAACRRLLNRQPDWMEPPAVPLHQELYFKMGSQLLRPKTIVSYTREPYVYGAGNVRITFDMAIRTGLASTRFLDPEITAFPVGGGGQMVLELKYDAFLPGQIADLLQIGSLRAGAFSKYAACRHYE